MHSSEHSIYKNRTGPFFCTSLVGLEHRKNSPRLRRCLNHAQEVLQCGQAGPQGAWPGRVTGADFGTTLGTTLGRIYTYFFLIAPQNDLI